MATKLAEECMIPLVIPVDPEVKNIPARLSGDVVNLEAVLSGYWYISLNN